MHFSPQRLPLRIASLSSLLFIATPFCSAVAHAQELVSLLDAGKDTLGWNFDNGREFPGAKGALAVDPSNKQNGRDSLKLTGDFTGGGAYVQANRPLSKVDIRELAMWVKNPDGGNFTIRLGDASGQTHQISLRVERSPDWQRIVFPVEQFFAKRGQTDSATIVAKYESWGGAKDGKWHGPATSLAIIIPRSTDPAVRNLWLANLSILPKPQEAPAPRLTSVIHLDELTEGEHDWRLDVQGKCSGSITVAKEAPDPGQSSLLVQGNQVTGGAYMAAVKDLRELGLQDVTAFRFKAKSDNLTSFSVQLADGTGQTHQKKGIPFVADGKWHDVEIRPENIAGGEHWGGANDGIWHGEPLSLGLLFNGGADPAGGKPAWLLNSVVADAVIAGVAQPAAYKADFEAAAVPPGWATVGSVAVDADSAFKGGHSLLLSRSLANIDRPVEAVSPSFPVAAGQWQLTLGLKSDLKSADASYRGTVELEYLDGGGKPMDRIGVAEAYGLKPWQPVSRTVELPAGAKSARFRVQINKAEGGFRVDELAAAYLAPAPKKDNRVTRIMFGSASEGNLLLPEAARTFTVEVEASKPLTEAQRNLSWEVRDYWGAEQTEPATASLERKDKKGGTFIYEGTLDLSKAPLEVGRYYEIHASIPRQGDEPFHNFTSLAILPEAITRKYKPEEVPFSSRSWDNRVPATFTLSDRIGIRVGGVWGGWDSNAPYKPYAPTLDVAKKLGMGWLTSTPAMSVERGESKYDEASLRQGVRNFIAAFGDTRPLYVDLGNEPHGTGDRVLKNVAAYKAIYEEIKKVDPTIPVIATSVEPNEEYFKAGYGKYCDIYDFHIYESADDVRHTTERYQSLMKQYDAVHPIWCTELGLNSQGLPRQLVAAELFRKLTIHFASGGSGVSWFGMLYPDRDGKLWGTSTDAQNVFDARYNRYAPKLDAVAYYNAVNAIAIKKFVAEKHYPNGISAFLFRDRDNQALQVLWKDKGRIDVALPLTGVNEVQEIGIDGRRSALNAMGKQLTVTVSEDPILLLYSGGQVALPTALSAPDLAVPAPPAMLLRGDTTAVSVALNGAQPGEVNLIAPQNWKVTKSAVKGDDGKAAVRFAIAAPENSVARVADLQVTRESGGHRTAELSLRLPVAGQLALTALPQGVSPSVRLRITNNGATAQTITWDAALPRERTMAEGKFGNAAATDAFFTNAPSGTTTLEGGQTSNVDLPLSGIDGRKLYQLKATVTDATGRALTVERPVGGFVKVARAAMPPKLDGVLEAAEWAAAPVQLIDQASQVYVVDGAALPWKGPQDLSATHQYLWDEKYLYVGVKVTDDKAGALKDDGDLWSTDGLQFLIDPARSAAEKAGKYDYVVGLGKKGPQAWCALSASAAAPTGAATDILVAAKRMEGSGSTNYEIAIPWSRLAPFKPAPGADLGLTLALNEDDGAGRHSFMTWFGNAHTKDVDIVGDLILGE